MMSKAQAVSTSMQSVINPIGVYDSINRSMEKDREKRITIENQVLPLTCEKVSSSIDQGHARLSLDHYQLLSTFAGSCSLVSGRQRNE